MSSADDESLFLIIENSCRLEKENEKLKEENALLKQGELDRMKYKPPIEAVVVYLYHVGAFMQCEESQEAQFSSFTKTNGNSNWGNGIKFNSIAGMNTQLFRLGFRCVRESKHYFTTSGVTLPTETWVKNM